MKKFILLMMAIGFWSSLFAQNIVEGEYFFDTKVDYGDGIAIVVDNPESITSLDLNLNDTIINLPDGLHRLFVRFKDSNGLWSHTLSFPVYVHHYQMTFVVEGEYFFDTKVDYGDGIYMDVNSPENITFADINLDTTMVNLPDGLHRMFFRFKDNHGLWSHTLSHPVYVKHNVVSTIVAGEYFIDTIVGFGEGDPIDVDNMASITQVIDTIIANLPLGEHDLFFRFKDSEGLWSHTFTDTICVGVATGTYSIDNSNYCQGDSVFVTYSSPEPALATYCWDLDNDGVYDDRTTTGEDFSHSLPENFTGITTIKYEMKSDLCLNSELKKDTFTFEVFPTYTISKDTTICSGESYLFPDGTTIDNIDAAFTHQSVFQTATFLCDSIISTHVDVETLDTSITDSGNVLMANEAGATYQWLDCDNGNAPISGENDQSFMPAVTGNYAVEITNNGCVATSGCHNVVIVGLVETPLDFEWFIYPNPFMDNLQIRCNCSMDTRYFIYDQLGRIVQSAKLKLDEIAEISTTEIKNGLYFIVFTDVESNEILFEKRIVKIE